MHEEGDRLVYPAGLHELSHSPGSVWSLLHSEGCPRAPPQGGGDGPGTWGVTLFMHGTPAHEHLAACSLVGPGKGASAVVG